MLKKSFALALPVLFFPLQLLAATTDSAQSDSLDKALKEIGDQRAQIIKQQKQIDALESKFYTSEQDQTLDSYRGRGLFKKKRNPEPEENKQDESLAHTHHEALHQTDSVGQEMKPRPAEKPPVIPAMKEEGSAMLAPGALVLEPGIDYNRSSALRVAIEGFTIVPALNIGAFDINRVDRDTVTATLGARVGITPRLEGEISIPYVYRNDNTVSRPIGTGSGVDVLSEVDGYGLGDIEASVHYQINKAKEGMPFFIGNLRFKSITGDDPFDVPIDPVTGLQLELPTGSGFYSLQPSLTAIFPSDPVVFYTNLGYLYNFERDIGGTTGTIDPGDSISLSFGMGFSVNERASFSMGYSHSMVLETERNGATVPTSTILQVGSLNFGYAYKLTNKVNLNLSIGAGLTDDAPDMSASFRVPIAFNLLK